MTQPIHEECHCSFSSKFLPSPTLTGTLAEKMVLAKLKIVRAAVFAVVLFHGWKASRGKSLPVSVLSLIGNLTAGQGFLGIVAGDVIGLMILAGTIRYLRRLSLKTFDEIKNDILTSGYGVAMSLPFVESRVEDMMIKTERDLKKSLVPKTFEPNTRLPKEGKSGEEILEIMREFIGHESGKWQAGKVSGAVYHGGDEHLQILNEAASMYSLSNPLHPDIWPSLRQMESDVIKMTASMVEGSCYTVCGSFTSGGTESIILATRAHKEYAASKKGIYKPEVIACVTAHAAIDKACELLGIHLVRVPTVPGEYTIDVAAVEKAISPDTVMIYTSAPQFPQGIIDPIAAVSKLGVKYGVGVHVDACLGGFVLPFARKLGYKIPDFDFSLPGVTSMSVDTHKYGFAVKGSSVVLYRNKQLRRAQYFAYPRWTGGLYTTATIAGSRPGALVAATWASLMHMGESGYMEAVDGIMKTTAQICEGIRKIDGVRLMGQPTAMIAAFDSDRFNIYNISDILTHKGWSLNALQRPASAHICVTFPMVGKAQQFLDDLQEAVNMVKNDPKAQEMATGSTPLYGSTTALPAGPVKDALSRYIDVTLS